MTRPVIPGVHEVDAGGARTISGVPSAITAFVDAFQAGPFDEPVRCAGYAAFQSVFGPSASLRQFFENGGLDAWVVRPSRFTDLGALDAIDLFNVLCLPGAADLSPAHMQSAYAAALGSCEQRRAFLILDIPKNVDTPVAMKAWLERNDGLRHRNAAVYFPRTLVADPLDPRELREVGASGSIAGLYARIDAARGVWKAPAGTEARLYGVQDFAYRLSDAEQDVLDALGVNCLRSLPRFGYLCWGARTLDPAREWKHVAARRLALFIEESVYRGTQWVVHEPHGERLWARIRRTVETFLMDLYRKGAFVGSTADQAFFVDCGPGTMTRADIDNGIVNIAIGFAPLKPAEFVVITIRQDALHSSAPRPDPYQHFSFRVLWDGRAVAGFSTCSALDSATPAIDHRDGGNNSTARALPGHTSHGRITLERGITHDLEFVKWASLVPPSKTPLTLERLDENKHVAARYVLHGCWASELKTLPDLDASASPLAIERMRLEVEGWERE